MKIISVVVSLLFSSFGFASEDSVMLWAGFDTSMSAKDVLKKTQEMMETRKGEKIGLEIRYGEKDEKVTSLGYLTAYCSMTANRRLRIKGELATIKWCFDSIVTRKKIPSDNKLVFIQLRVDGPTTPPTYGLSFGEFYLNFYIAADKKYEETSISELLWPDRKEIHVPPNIEFVPDITKSQGSLFESEDVLIFLRPSYFTVSPFGFVHLDYVSKQAYLEADRQAIETSEAKVQNMTKPRDKSEDEL
jgi:hypothetical protein